MEVPNWVTEKYGNVQIHKDEVAPFKIVDFIEREGTLALGVYVSDASGDPIQNVAVVFEWPGAPPLPSEAGWVDRGVVEFTNEGGYAAMIMGGGSYYFPQHGQEGAYRIWLHGEGMSEMVSGLGMLGQTHYEHLDTHFCMQPTQPEPPDPEPDPEPDPGPPPPPPPPADCEECCEEACTLMREILVELRRLADAS